MPKMPKMNILFILTFILLPFASAEICDGIPDFNYIASDRDCYIYYQCIDGHPFQLQCPRGNFFSTERQTCVPYDESDCPLLTTTTSSSRPPHELTCSHVPDFSYIPSTERCDFYFQCIDGNPNLLKCPRGFYFSFREQNCVRPDESDCSLIHTTTREPNVWPNCDYIDDFGYVPSKRGCQFYYQCIESDQFLLKCPRGLYFNFRRQTCVRYDEAECWGQ